MRYILLNGFKIATFKTKERPIFKRYARCNLKIVYVFIFLNMTFNFDTASTTRFLFGWIGLKAIALFGAIF